MAGDVNTLGESLKINASMSWTRLYSDNFVTKQANWQPAMMKQLDWFIDKVIQNMKDGDYGKETEG